MRKDLQLSIVRPKLMDMSTLENATRRSILEDLWISKRISEATIEATEVAPDTMNLAIYDNRRRLKGLRDEFAEAEMQRLATIRIVGETRPTLGDRI
jgi:hypothetical protein